MSYLPYMLLKTAVSFAVFILSLPIIFLLLVGAAQVIPQSSPALFLIVLVPILIGELILSHLVTEKLAQRWSR